MSRITHFTKGDIVLVGRGNVHWEVVDGGSNYVLLKSGLSGRRMWADTDALTYWDPNV